MLYLAGSTSVSVDVQIVDDTGLPVTGLVAATFPTLTYSLAGPNADVSFPALSDLATITTAYSSGGVKERGNGYYRLDVPNGAFSTGGVTTIRGEATGKHVLCERLHIVAFNPQDAVHLGLSALPNTACTTNASLITSGTGTDQLSVTSGRVDIGKALGNAVTTASNGILDVNAKNINNVSASSVTTINANLGTTQPINFTGTGASALVKSDMQDIAGSAVSTSTAQIGVNVVNIAGQAAVLDGNNFLKVDAEDWKGSAVNALVQGKVDATFNVRSNTAQAGAGNTITLDSGASATDNLYRGLRVSIVSGTGVGQSRLIGGYVGSTKVASVVPNWTTNPDSSSVFILEAWCAVDLELWELNTPNSLVSGRVDVSVGAMASNVITAAAINAAALNGKGDWLLASSYTTPPTTAAIATGVWQDTTASDFTTAGSIGKSLGGAFTALGTSVYTVAALANAPGGGSGVTVNGYASGQDPATLVLGAMASSWNTAGTIGQKINSAGGAADPLTNPVPGSYAAGTAGAALGRIGTATISVVSPVTLTGGVTITWGDDYRTADGRSLSWTDTGSTWPNLTGATIELAVNNDAIKTTGTCTNPGSSNQNILVELTSLQTMALPEAPNPNPFVPNSGPVPSTRVPYSLVAILSDGHRVTLAANFVTVISNQL